MNSLKAVFFLLVLNIVGFIALSLVIMLISGVFSKETAEFRGQVAQTEAVRADPNFRIANYDKFFNQCAAVQSAETQIELTKEDLAMSPRPARELQLQANLSAQRAQRAELINRYNADAAKVDTGGQFLSINLPSQLNINQENTTCAAN